MTDGLSGDVQRLVDVSAAFATRESALLELALTAALDSEVDPVAVEEALLQGYLFLGYPSALAAFGLWRRLSGREAPPPSSEAREDWVRRGEEVCQRVYGRKYESLRHNVHALHGDLETWMIEEGYGKVLGRPGLALKSRELCIVALLAVLEAPTQLYSHLRGALNVGATPAQVEEALARAVRYCGPTGTQRAEDTWWQVWKRWEGGRGAGQES